MTEVKEEAPNAMYKPLLEDMETEELQAAFDVAGETGDVEMPDGTKVPMAAISAELQDRQPKVADHVIDPYTIDVSKLAKADDSDSPYKTAIKQKELAKR